MWNVHREKEKKAKRKGRVESDVCFLQTLVSHLTCTSSPHKAFGSYQKLTLLLQNVSEKRKSNQGVVQAHAGRLNWKKEEKRKTKKEITPPLSLLLPPRRCRVPNHQRAPGWQQSTQSPVYSPACSWGRPAPTT